MTWRGERVGEVVVPAWQGMTLGAVRPVGARRGHAEPSTRSPLPFLFFLTLRRAVVLRFLPSFAQNLC